jgi:hypothetical protein
LQTTKRETHEDLQREATIVRIVAESQNTLWAKAPDNKYRIDAYLWKSDENSRVITGWVEAKWYSKPGFYGMNVAKYMHCRNLFAHTRLPVLFGLRIPGKIGVINLFSKHTVPPRILVCGGVPNGRTPNPDDIEPMAMYEESNIRWLRET